MRQSTPKFIQGVFAFKGAGLDKTELLASFTVAADKRAQPVYLRAGNSSGDLIILSMTQNGELMRYFPVGAKSAEHVPLTVVDDILPETRIDVSVAAPAGVSGTVVFDFGLVEI
jgi:hypothetical protein